MLKIISTTEKKRTPIHMKKRQEMKLLKALRKEYHVMLNFGDFVWIASLGAFFVVCLELFYRMIVNYNHKYPSDVYYYAVKNVRTGEEKGRFIGELFQFLHSINGSIVEIDFFMASVIIGIIIFNYISLRYFIKDDGYIDKVPRFVMQGISIALLFMGPIYVPFVYERYYKHAFKAFAWHSPTQQAMVLFSLIASICFLKMYQRYEAEGISIKWWTGTAIAGFFAAWSKPSFTISFIISVIIMFFVDLIRGGKDGVIVRLGKLFIMGCALLPGGFYTLWLHNASFTEGTQYGEEHAVLIDFSHVLEYDNLLGTIVFCLTIPIVVFALNSDRFKNPKYKFALYIFLMGMLQWAMFTETGRRGNYGNFTWGRTYGIYYINLAASAVAIELFFNKNLKIKNKRMKTLYLVIIAGVILASIISQLNYFRLILTGHGYQL